MEHNKKLEFNQMYFQPIEPAIDIYDVIALWIVEAYDVAMANIQLDKFKMTKSFSITNNKLHIHS